MKQGHCITSGIKDQATKLFKNFSVQLHEACKKLENKSNDKVVTSCLKYIEELIIQFVCQVDQKYQNLEQAVDKINLAMNSLMTQNSQLKIDINHKNYVILEQNIKIEALETINLNLSQSLISIQNNGEINQEDMSIDEDSLENINESEIQEYISEQSSFESQSEEIDSLNQLL